MKKIAIWILMLLLASAGAAAEEKEKKAEEGKKGKKHKLDKKAKLKVGARIHTLWTLTDEAEQPENAFGLDMARVKFDWRQSKLVRGVLQLDVDQLQKSASKTAVLRDAYVKVAPMQYLQFRMGQFKRQFSRVELRSRSRLETVHRGLSNDWIIEELGYGDRDLGFQVEGRVGDNDLVEYAVGVFNGSGKNAAEEDPDGSKDFVGRVEVKPLDMLSVGANGVYKTFDTSSSSLHHPDSAWAAGGDFRLKMDGLRLLGEYLRGENFLYSDMEHMLEEGMWADYYHESVATSWSTVLMLTYKHKLSDKYRLALQPVVKGEYLVPDDSLDDAYVWALTSGVNLFIGKHVRLMFNSEIVRPAANAPITWMEYDKYMVQMAFDI